MAGAMSGPAVMPLDQVVDGQRLRGTSILFIVLAALAMASDGYDLATTGYLQPEVLKQSHLARTALVPAFSAGIIGMAVGGPLLGLLGDRYGRKPMIIAGLCAIALLDLIGIRVFGGVMATGTGLAGLALLRFCTGVAVGGVFPNVMALIAELTPRAARARVLVIVALGVPLGIAIPGLVANRLVPTYGWQAILVVGSLMPLVVAVAVAALLPESIKFLVERGGREAQALRLARRLRPDLRMEEGSRLSLPSAGKVTRGSMRPLFAGALGLVTPMLWVSQAANQMANFFSLTWLPTLLQAGGASTSTAGGTAALFSLGGLGAGVLLLLVIDRLGVVPLVAMFLVGAPLVAGMTLTSLSPAVHALVIAGAGFCVTGIQIGLTALLGLLYPTAIRSVGTGWTQAAGRVGGLAAPLVGGLLLGLHVRLERLTLAPAALLLIGGVACIILMAACRRQFGSFRVSEFALAENAARVPVDPLAGTI